MRQFIRKIMFVASTSILLIIAVYVIMFMFSSNVTGLAHEVFYVLEKAEHNSGLPAVILGDSVCNQLWPQNNDSPNISHLGCNQAITPAGTYLLLKKYLEHNPQTQEVFYIVRPQTLGNDLNLNYTYQYFVIPFINPESIKLLDEETQQKLYSKFGKFFVDNAYIKRLLLNNNLFMKQYLNHIKTRPETQYIHRLSRTAIIYLPKIRELCRERNIRLHVLPLPVPDTSENYGWEDFAQDVRDNGLDDVLGEFTGKIHYCPDDWYRDGSHFKPEILEQHIDELRAYVMN